MVEEKTTTPTKESVTASTTLTTQSLLKKYKSFILPFFPKWTSASIKRAWHQIFKVKRNTEGCARLCGNIWTSSFISRNTDVTFFLTWDQWTRRIHNLALVVQAFLWVMRPICVYQFFSFFASQSDSGVVDELIAFLARFDAFLATLNTCILAHG